jgi:hypothetical protein
MTRIKIESNKKSNFIKKRLIMIYDTASSFLSVSELNSNSGLMQGVLNTEVQKVKWVK